MREEFLIVARREIGALVRAPRFRAMQGRVNDRFGYIQHRRQFQRGDQLGGRPDRVRRVLPPGVRRKGLIVTLSIMAVGTIAIALAPSYATIGLAAPVIVLIGRLLQGFSGAVDSRTLLHGPLHLFTYGRHTLPPSGLVQKLIL